MISDDDVARAAALLGLEIPAPQLTRVAAHLQGIEQIARQLDGVELDPFTDEIAPVWRP